MAFFTDYQRKLASVKTPRQLRRAYKQSERELQAAAKSGDVGTVAHVMNQQHRDAEYALLYQQTQRALARRKRK